jgi:hypothetical protein
MNERRTETIIAASSVSIDQNENLNQNIEFMGGLPLKIMKKIGTENTFIVIVKKGSDGQYPQIVNM